MSSSALNCCLVRHAAHPAASLQPRLGVEVLRADAVAMMPLVMPGGPEAEETRPGLQDLG